MPTKLIEVALPLDDINREATRENYIYRGNPSAVHKWWAQRPLAACRAVIFAQLVDDPSANPADFPTERSQRDERERLFEIIRQLVKWENLTDETVLESARAEIRRCYPEGPPGVLDPFAGGASIPLEAQRLGLEAHASDLNPVAVIINKALIEIPPRYTDRPPVHPPDVSQLVGTHSWSGTQGLCEDILWYGRWLVSEASARLSGLYPTAIMTDGTEVKPIAWLWTRTIACPNPACGATMPLIRSMWLGKKKGREAWVNPIADQKGKRVRFEVGHGKDGPPIDSTVGRKGAKCLVCNTPVPLDLVRAEGRAGRIGTQLLAIVVETSAGRAYIAPTEEHERAAEVARPTGAPDTDLPLQALGFRVQAYGMTKHADLFTARQLVVMCELSDLVREVRAKVMVDTDGDHGYADAIAMYLAFAVDKYAQYGCSLAPWYPKEDRPTSLFSRQAVSMVWDFVEVWPLSDIGGSVGRCIEGVAGSLPGTAAGGIPGEVQQVSASDRPYTGLVVSTDPPYYDNIGYADLSDFFYVWLRRTLGEFFPDLFGTLLTPKRDELVADPFRHGGRKYAEHHFEDGFREVFSRIASQHPSETPMTVYYAFKQTDPAEGNDRAATASTGWEKVLSGMIEAGLILTGTWPIRGERGGRMRDVGSNALASCIVLVCRMRPADAGVTDRRGFLNELKTKLTYSMHELQSGGIAPVDLAQAAIGPGMAVFSSYAKVLEPDGLPMKVRTALSLINQVLDQVAAEQEGEFDEETRWATAWFSEFGLDLGPFGRADDLARAKNVAVDGLVRGGIIVAQAGKVRLLDRSELNSAWNPVTDTRLSVWEVTQHLIRRLLGDGGERAAASLVATIGGLAEPARDLAYRLFEICERRGWAREAGPYNALATAWPELTRMAASGELESGQGSLL